MNLSVNLASITDGPLSYALDAFYNSRSPAVCNTVVGCLNGWGWKMLDYPKIVQQSVTRGPTLYYFLDGAESFPLTIINNTFVAGMICSAKRNGKKKRKEMEKNKKQKAINQRNKINEKKRNEKKKRKRKRRKKKEYMRT